MKSFRFPPGTVACATLRDLDHPVPLITAQPLVPGALYRETDRRAGAVFVELDPGEPRGAALILARAPWRGSEAVVAGWLDAADADGYAVEEPA